MPTHYDGSKEECRALDLYIKLFRAAESVAQASSKSMAAAGLTGTQFGTLETLYHLGPLNASTLAHKHLKSRNNFTTVIDNLVKLGYAERTSNDQDRREVIVQLTERGRAVIASALPGHVAEVVAAMQCLSAEDQCTLSGLLSRLGHFAANLK